MKSAFADGVAEERTFLFVAGDDLRSAEAAARSAADVVILDLEDLLTPERKEPARQALPETLARRPEHQRWFVRINPVESDLAYGDIEAAVIEGVSGIVVPKVERREQLAVVDWAMAQGERRLGVPCGSLEQIAIIETAAAFTGLAGLGESRNRPLRLGFGAGDLVRDLDLRPTWNEEELGPYRADLAKAARTFGLAPPIDSVWLNLDDAEGLEASTRRGRSAGLRGKFCLGPGQINTVVQALQASAEDVRVALAALAAFDAATERGEGWVIAGGIFVDEPVAQRFRKLIAQTER